MDFYGIILLNNSKLKRGIFMTTKERKRKLVTISFHSEVDDTFDEKALTRVLHRTLWNMRGQWGYSNVYIQHVFREIQVSEPGHPKEALTWDMGVERVYVVAKTGNTIQDVQLVYENHTETYDYAIFNPFEVYNFNGKEVVSSTLTKDYLHKVVQSRLNYFGSHGLTYDYKCLENVDKDFDRFD